VADAITPLVRRARRQAARLNGLVGDLLDVSRIQADRLDLHAMPADVRDVVREAVEEQRQAAPERVIILTVPDTPVALTCDPDRIGQVVTNYLTNALKFAPPEFPLQVRVTQSDTVATVSVTDQGPGIPTEEQSCIWDRFQRVDAIEHQSGSYIGLGLGLYICKTIIERHQGAIGVTSQVGAGSTFWFSLPLYA
jgi:signal transduction histidine kinase